MHGATKASEKELEIKRAQLKVWLKTPKKKRNKCGKKVLEDILIRQL